MNAYHAELETDWWERGQDFLADMWGCKMSLRAIWVRIENLGPNSAFSRAVNEQWGIEHHLLASIIDVLNLANWQRGGTEQNKPEPIARPGVKTKKEKYKEQAEAERARRALIAAKGGAV